MTRPIVTVADRKYLPAITYLLLSLIDSYCGEDKLKFYVVYAQGDINEEEQIAFKEPFHNKHVEIFFVTSADLDSADTTQVFSRYETKIDQYLLELNMGQKMVPNWRAFRKMWIADAVPEDEILFLDADTFAYGNIHYLLDFPVNRKFAAALDNWPNSWTVHSHPFETHMSHYPHFHTDHMPGLYRSDFNSGVFITSLNYWREQKFIEKTKEFMDKFIILYTDQDILNHFFDNDFTVLPKQFNCHFKTLLDCPGGRINWGAEPWKPVIVHFCGPFKPMFNEYSLYDTGDAVVKQLPLHYAQQPVLKVYNGLKRRFIIRDLYLEILRREPDDHGLQGYANGDLTIEAIRNEMANSKEAKSLPAL